MKAENRNKKTEKEKEQWIPAACWHDCGGRCLLRVLVKDGIIRRIKTDDLIPDTPDRPQQRACQRGLSQRQQVLSPDRLLHPMKRKHWSVDDPCGHLRGRDEWEQISWEEAFSLCAKAIRKIYTGYGPQSALVLGGSDIPKVLSAMGGYTPRWGQVSWGAWPAVYELMTGHGKFAFAWDAPDRFTLREQKLIILWGANPAVSSAGLAEYNYLSAHRNGCRFVAVDPRYNESIQPLHAQWIPVRPGTDTAMILGMLHHIIENGLHDKEYLDRYCVGFDAEHMPEETEEFHSFQPLERPLFSRQMAPVDRGDNLCDYLFAKGKYEGTVPKTPEWAAGICGVPAETIRQLAREYACTKPACIFSGGAPARIHHGEAFPQALVTLGLVCGQIGRGGAGVCACMHERASNGGEKLCMAGSPGTGSHVPENPFNQKNYGINNGELWTAVLNGSYTGPDGSRQKADIRMICQEKGGALNQRTGMSLGIEAYRKVDFALCVNYVMNPSAQFSDIVLPCTTPWEQPGCILGGNREILLYGQQVLAPIGEARSDQQIARGLARALGISEDLLYEADEWQQLFNRLAGSRYKDTDGCWKPLLTITQKDLERYEVKAGHPLKGTPQVGCIPLTQWEEEGIFRIPEPEQYRYHPFETFIMDPLGHPLSTATGKFEIYCKGLSDYIGSLGFEKKSPLPVYEPVWKEESDSYPYLLLSWHGPGRANHTMEQVPWLKEAFPQLLWIHPEDAAKYQIREHDRVLLENAYGRSVVSVLVTERMTPGVLALPQGAWARFDEHDIDHAGSANVLTAPLPSGQGHSGYNSVRCRISKYQEQTS